MNTQRKKIKRSLVLILGSTALLMSVLCCDTSTTSGEIFMNKTIDETYTLIQDNANNPDFIILDVRTPSEYASGYIENAVNIDYYADDFEDTLDQLDKSKTYLVYCRTGSRSASAMNIMKKLDFIEVYNMQGGITAWTSAGYPVVS